MTTIFIPPGTAQLRTESARSQIAITGWGALLFGSVFLATGVFVMVRALAGGEEGMHAPRWVVVAAGAVFALAGTYVMANGASDVVRQGAAKRRAAERPREPWAWDYDWRPEGIEDGTRRDMARAFGFAFSIALFLTPFHWVGFFAKGTSWPFAAGALLFDLVVVWQLVRGARLVLMRRRYGSPALRFRHFPFHAGSAVEVSLDSFGELSLVPRLTATLRCIQERYETRRSGRERSTEVVCYALWSATQTAEKNRHGIYELAFDLPADAPASALSERPARFWELELKSDDVPGVDYCARFLVPVYGTPAVSR